MKMKWMNTIAPAIIEVLENTHILSLIAEIRVKNLTDHSFKKHESCDGLSSDKSSSLAKR